MNWNVNGNLNISGRLQEKLIPGNYKRSFHLSIFICIGRLKNKNKINEIAGELKTNTL